MEIQRDLSLFLSETCQMERIFPYALNALMRFPEVDEAAIYSCGVPDGGLGLCCGKDILKDISFKQAASFAQVNRSVYLTGEDALPPPVCDGLPHPGALGAFGVIPLKTRGKTVFLFVLMSRTRNIFSPHIRISAETIAAQISGALRWFSPTDQAPLGWVGDVRADENAPSGEEKTGNGLGKSGKELKKILETMTEGVLTISREGKVLYINTSGQRILGIDRARILHKEWKSFLENLILEDGAALLPEACPIALVLSGKRQMKVLTVGVKHEARSVCWVNFSTSAIKSNGDVMGAVATLTDISGLVKIQEVLRLRDLALKTSISGFALVDLGGRLTYGNKSFLKLWGYEKNRNILGAPLIDFLSSREKTARILEHLKAHGAWVGEISGVRRNGGLFDLQMSASMVRDKMGTPICLMASFVDITEQKKLKELMVQSEKLSSLGQLAAGLAHELKNPLAVISTCSQFCIENEKLTRRLEENFQLIYTSCQRANRLIRNLLTFARPSVMEWKRLDVNETIRQMLSMAKLQANADQIVFDCDLDEGIPQIVGDEEKLGQVLINIILNAIQAVSRKGTIRLRTFYLSEEEMVRIDVIDDGPGIPHEYLNRIFDPFFTTKDRGTGLGLSICHSIILQHQGDISARLNEGRGTTMTLKLPLTRKVKELE